MEKSFEGFFYERNKEMGWTVPEGWGPKQHFLKRWISDISAWLVETVHSLLSFSYSVMFYSLQPCGLQHTRLSCPSLSPEVCSNSCPLSQWCHPTISSSITPFSSCPPSFSASGSFPMGWLFASSGQSSVASTSTSVLPMNIQGWFPLGLTGWISLKSKGLSKNDEAGERRVNEESWS